MDGLEDVRLPRQIALGDNVGVLREVDGLHQLENRFALIRGERLSDRPIRRADRGGDGEDQRGGAKRHAHDRVYLTAAVFGMPAVCASTRSSTAWAVRSGWSGVDRKSVV